MEKHTQDSRKRSPVFFKSEEDLILENTLPEKFGKAFV